MRRLLLVPIAIAAAVGCKKDARDRPAQRDEATGAAEDASTPTGPAPSFEIEAMDELAPKGPAPEAIALEVGRGDCSSDYAPRPDRDRSPMCKVEGGTFLMGNPDGTGDEAPRKVEVAGFYMDQHEVTVAQYAHFLDALGTNEACPDSFDRLCVKFEEHPDLLWQLSGKTGRFVPREGMADHPILQVSAEGMLKYCHWVGKRMPTAAEWEYAARHDPATGKDLRYPWGNEFEPGRANCAEELCKDGHEFQSSVGSDWGAGPAAGASPWGLVDMAGNAEERVLDCKDPMTLSTCSAQDRGGYFPVPSIKLLAAWHSRPQQNPMATMVTGFRCVRPGT